MAHLSARNRVLILRVAGRLASNWWCEPTHRCNPGVGGRLNARAGTQGICHLSEESCDLGRALLERLELCGNHSDARGIETSMVRPQAQQRLGKKPGGEDQHQRYRKLGGDVEPLANSLARAIRACRL